MKRSNSGQSLVGTLVAVVIVIFATVVYINDPFNWIGHKERADGQGETLVGRSLLAGKDVTCREDLKQLRLSIMSIKDTTDDLPTGLQETALPNKFYSCPVGNEDYNYDPETGNVSCPHPGHEKY